MSIIWAAVVVCAVVATVVLTDGKSSSGTPAVSGYAAQLGPAGTSATLQLPQQVGTLELLTPDSVPMWTDVPKLLPSSPATTYSTIGGLYVGAGDANGDGSGSGNANGDGNGAQGLDLTVDGVYALGDGRRQGVFSVSPTALIALVAQQMYVTDFEPFPSGPRGGVMECGTYGIGPLCVWADRSTLGFVSYTGTPGSLATLATETAAIRATIEVG